jgi:hypothetical protein
MGLIPSLTLCQLHVPLIKYPQFLDVLNAFNVQPHNMLLHTVWHCRLCSWALKTAETAYSLVVHCWMVFLKTRPFVKRNNAEFTNVSSFYYYYYYYYLLQLSFLLLAVVLTLVTNKNIYIHIQNNTKTQYKQYCVFVLFYLGIFILICY